MKTIYLQTQGGLCNRMRAMAAAISLSKEYGTKLIAFWPQSEECYCRFDQIFADIPNVRVINYFQPTSRFQLKHRTYRWLVCGRKIKNVKRFLEIESVDDSLRQCLLHGEDVLIETYNEFFEADFKYFKISNSDILSKTNQLISEEEKNIIGVHIRRTDNNLSIDNSPTELFIKLVNDEIKMDSSVKLFLATDSPEEEDVFRSLYHDRLICNSEKCLDRDSERGMKDAVIDLFCLSKCKKIYGSFWSSFSQVAAIWNEKKPLIIVHKDQ